MKVLFDVQHLYYLPQYLPVISLLVERRISVKCVFYRSADLQLQEVSEQIAQQEKLDVQWVDNYSMALEFYLAEKAEWIVFGNAVDELTQIHKVSKTALMQHGIGPKSCYYEVSNNQTSVRFVEGQHRLNRLISSYPDGRFVDTGYAKLDPVLDQSYQGLNLSSLGLDASKKTILYAPTFYPSSIECLPKSFASDFSDFNILIKPHFFTLTKKKYHRQRKLLNHWNSFENVYLASVEDYNLLPFMASADVMMSDASSAIFEFAALNKPVIWCNFYKLRWSYRGIFSYRFKQRLDSDLEYFHDVAEQVDNYSALVHKMNHVFALSDDRIKQRGKTVAELAGVIDGQSSVRVVNYLLENI